MKKIIYTVIFLIIAAGCAVVMWSVSGYLFSLRENVRPVLPETASLLPGDTVNIGVPLRAEVSFKLPRFRKVLNCSAQLGKGSAATAEVSWKIRRHSWKYNEWQISVPICCLTSGTIPAGRLTVELSPGRGDPQKLRQELIIPAIQAREISGITLPEPELAGEMVLRKKVTVSPYYLFLLLIPLLLFIWYWFRRRKNMPPPVSLRAATLETLEALRSGIFSRNLSAEKAVSQLSDIIRHFLEKRYTLPLSSRTTPEFMDEIDRTAALPEEHRPFLRDFMNAADLIKFAHAPCDNASVNIAIDSAEKLVKNTTPAEENKNV